MSPTDSNNSYIFIFKKKRVIKVLGTQKQQQKTWILGQDLFGEEGIHGAMVEIRKNMDQRN